MMKCPAFYFYPTHNIYPIYVVRADYITVENICGKSRFAWAT